MARLLVQSAIDFQFLHWSPRAGSVDWTPSLATAIRFGIVRERERAAELVADHCEPGSALIVDLDLESDR